MVDSILHFQQAAVAQAEAIHRLEAEGYPPEEAASAEQIAFRLDTAPEYVRKAR
jgi:hypothetical protein